VNFDVSDQLLIKFSAFVDTGDKVQCTMYKVQLDSTSAVHRLQNFKTASDSVRRMCCAIISESLESP
jgi:hypothetical protein